MVLKNLSVDKQREFSEFLLKHIGYDFNRGRLLETTHPYTIDLGFSDVRVSTRYEDDKSEFIKVALHEGGHALYEQGVDPDTKNSREMETYSIGFHESQSRIMEVYAGDTKAFWEFVYPKLQLDFAENFENVSLDQWLEHLRYVKPSPIRVEADEVTYNLHIIIRYEIEKDLITGVLDVADVPEVWNQKYKDYLGIDIASDSQGCLQDVHWSEALFGYFPTYSFGNVVAAQIWEFFTDNPGWEDQFKSGDVISFRNWLKDNFHQHGSLYTSFELLQKVTGKSFGLDAYKRHIRQKYLG